MYISRTLFRRLNDTVALLRWGYGALIFFSGFDKIVDITNTQWIKLVSPEIEQSLPFKFAHIVLALSVLQMTIGVMLLIPRLARWGAYLGALLLLFLAGDLWLTGIYYNRAVLNGIFAVSLFVLGHLIAVKEGIREASQHD